VLQKEFCKRSNSPLAAATPKKPGAVTTWPHVCAVWRHAHDSHTANGIFSRAAAGFGIIPLGPIVQRRPLPGWPKPRAPSNPTSPGR
jgi:hypothetical protein